MESDPQSFNEVVNSPEGLLWNEVIKGKIDFILQNQTWELVDIPQGFKPLDRKSVV